MKFSKTDIAEVVDEFLYLIDRADIRKADQLHSTEGRVITGKKQGHAIMLEDRPSQAGTITHTVSYIIQEAGIPLEVKVNAQKGYSLITIKSQENFPGYEAFGRDRFDNIAQLRKLETTLLQEVFDAVRELGTASST